jgi:uncharacterized Zn finger protein (UPF0148 family)
LQGVEPLHRVAQSCDERASSADLLRKFLGNVSMTMFNELADRFGTAEIALNLAIQRLASDKERRKGSIFGRFVDLVSETDAEEAERKAREQFERISAETHKDVGKRMHAMAMVALAEDDEEAFRRAEQVDVSKRSLSTLQDVERMLGLARDAQSKLVEAASECEQASSMEMMDAFSANKGISAMSSVYTSSAKTSLNTAREALKALSEALPDRARGLDAEAPDDLLDLVLDFADFPIDFLSWMNMDKLDTAGDQCKATGIHVAKVIDELVAQEAQRRVAHERELALLAEIDRPYLTATLEYVPQSIRFAVPEHLINQNSNQRDMPSTSM